MVHGFGRGSQPGLCAGHAANSDGLQLGSIRRTSVRRTGCHLIFNVRAPSLPVGSCEAAESQWEMDMGSRGSGDTDPNELRIGMRAGQGAPVCLLRAAVVLSCMVGAGHGEQGFGIECS